MLLKKIFSAVAITALSVTLLSGCAQDIRSTTYTASSVGQASTTYKGVVSSVRIVTVKKSNELEGNRTGGLLGGVAGGFLGNQIGGGTGRVAATVGGAVLGAAAGAAVEDKVKTQQAYEYVVRTDSGSYLTVVQGLDSSFAVGQRVLVVVGNGVSRVIPDQSGL